MARSQSDAAFLKEARSRFEMGQEAIHKQRQRELADLAFYAGGDFQWDPDALKARRAQNADNQAGLPPMPARPVITVNKVREPIHQILNQERQSDMSIELAPADDFAGLVGPIDPTEIEVREGLVRRIQRQSEAADARTWGFMRGVICGTGWWRINTKYASGKTFDQDLEVGRIFNQASVTADPTHEQPDGADVDWLFQGADLPFDRYKAEHPGTKDEPNRVARASDDEFRAYGEEYPGWFAGEGDRKSVRVVEYFHTERKVRRLVLLADGTEAWKDEVPDGAEILDERDVVERSIKWAKIDATQVLEETDWPSRDIPFIKYVGEELQPFDHERRAEGIVRQSRGGQEGFNAFISKFVEVVGLTPLNNVMAPEGVLDDYKAWWQVRNVRAVAWLPFKKRDLEGNLITADDIKELSQAGPIQEIAMGLQIFDEAIKSTTMIPAVQLGHSTDAHLKSGKAIQLMQSQAELGTSNYLDNLKRSIRREGEIINNLLYPIYGTKPGRLVRIMTGENESQTVQIGQNGGNNGAMGLDAALNSRSGVSRTDASAPSGTPLAAFRPPNGARMVSPASSSLPGGLSSARPQPKIYRLTPDANFNVVVKVTRGFESRRMEESTTIAQLIQANPGFMAQFGDLFFANQDGPGHEEMAERAKLMLAPPIQQYLAQKQQGQNIPPELQAQFAQLKGQLQHAEQILAQAKQELEGQTAAKQMEQQTKLQIERMSMEKDIQLQAMKAAAQIAVARISAAKGTFDEVREDAEEALALAQTQMHEAGQNALDRQHERDMASQQHQQALEQGAQGVAGTMATQQQQAQLQPPSQPEQGGQNG